MTRIPRNVRADRRRIKATERKRAKGIRRKSAERTERTRKFAAGRLEYLRGELRAERISQGELAELRALAPHIKAGDVELLEAAGVPEFPEIEKVEKPDRNP